jgi:hypothetical protein
VAFNWSGNIKWFDCIEESKVLDVDTGTYISVASGNIYITVQYNSDTRNIALNQRFYVTNQPFKVTGIDKSQEGLIKFNCAMDLIDTVNDDVENNIVDRWRYETGHTYTLTIINGETANVLINDIIQCFLKKTKKQYYKEMKKAISSLQTNTDPETLKKLRERLVKSLQNICNPLLEQAPAKANVGDAIKTIKQKNS